MRSSHKPSVRFEAIAHKLAAEDDREFWQLASKIYVEYELTMAKLFKTEMTRAAAHGGLLAFSFFAGLFTLLLHAAGPPPKSQFSDEWKGWKSYTPIWHPSGKLYGE
jgi:hypothetical protein